MSKLVVVMFPDAAMIQEPIDALKKLRAERHIKLYASTVVARDPNGKLSIQEVTKEGLGGAAVGAFIGALAGFPVGPLAATIGAAAGALIGGSAELTNEGVDTEFAEKISRELAPGKAAVVAEVDNEGVVAFEALMKSIGGTVVRK